MAGFVNSQAASILDDFITGLSNTAYIALFTAIPGEGGTMGAECSYTSYARISCTSWASATIADPSVKATSADITFPQCTGATETITNFGIMNTVTGGQVLFTGSFTSNLVVSNGVTPIISSGSLDIRLD